MKEEWLESAEWAREHPFLAVLLLMFLFALLAWVVGAVLIPVMEAL